MDCAAMCPTIIVFRVQIGDDLPNTSNVLVTVREVFPPGVWGIVA